MQLTQLKHFSKTIALSALLVTSQISLSHAETVTSITGAGATFPYPLYGAWAQTYQQEHNIQLNYQPIGSGAGIKQIQAKTVDFGASDKPLSSQDLQQNALFQFPTVIGAVVPIVNIGGIASGQLKLSGQVLADIFLDKIKNWNDPAIVKLNPGVTLPDQAITVVHRSDGSGTTYLFTNYLGKVNPDWLSKVGNDTAVSWPTGLGGKGNEGVSVYVQHTAGSIGYVEYAYAKQAKLNVVQLQNSDGNFVAPNADSFKAAAASVTWQSPDDFTKPLTNLSGAQSWPIIGATFILLNQNTTRPDQTRAVLEFFNWAFMNGAKAAIELDYVPLPESAINMIQNSWKTELKDSQGQLIWKK